MLFFAYYSVKNSKNEAFFQHKKQLYYPIIGFY